jgi:outer membrane protein
MRAPAGRRAASVCAIWMLGLLGLAAPLGAQDATLTSRRLSLDEALHLASGASEDVGIARAGVDRTTGQRRQARSGFFPQLTGNASYTRTIKSQFDIARNAVAAIPPNCLAPFTADPTQPFGTRLDSVETALQCVSRFGAAGGGGLADLPFGRKNAYNFNVALSQRLFDGGRTSGQAKAAGAQLRSAEVGLTAAQAQLALDVTQAYYDALLADRLVAIAEKTLEQADTTLKNTQLARQVGNLSEFDLLRARVTRDNQRPVLIARRADRDVAYLRLRQLVNLPPELSLELTSALGDTTALATAQMTTLVSTPGDTNPEVRAPVRQATEQVDAQRGLVQAAKGGRWPSVSLTSTFAQFAYPTDAFPGSNDFLTDWSIGLGLSVPLFTGGRLGGDAQVATANLREAELRLSQTRKLARLDSRSTATQLVAAAAGWEASAGTVEQADRAYQIADLRYREGLSTQTELLDARVALEQAEGNRARAARDLQVARMRLLLLPSLPLAASTAGTPAASSTTTTPTNTPTQSSTTPIAGVTGAASAPAGATP